MRSDIHRFIRKKRVFQSAEAEAFGISRMQLAKLRAEGAVERLSRGVYTAAGSLLEHPELRVLESRSADYVVCLLSALRMHDLTTQLPDSLWIAVPQGARKPALAPYRLDCVHLSPKAFRYGIVEREVEGRKVRLYSAAKTVADCFKFRNRIGLDVAIEALREGWRRKRFTGDELDRAARVDRVSRIIRPYLEAIQG